MGRRAPLTTPNGPYLQAATLLCYLVTHKPHRDEASRTRLRSRCPSARRGADRTCTSGRRLAYTERAGRNVRQVMPNLNRHALANRLSVTFSKLSEKKSLFFINAVILERRTDAIRSSRQEPCWRPRKCTVLCSLDFDNDDLYNTKRKRLRRIHKGAVPIK
ncbi:hypothetical protein EVAR_75285_1 [Eumeta japonica]|uniref:Uncharacterized protein n=1 Tax=Eumeta variegata TaxID=151549 RepID=A0A4C1YY92_EUMVA|nr:hypothetical protein EVAR_75285_1 [Eumeta japonica]